eukprot:20650-Heterococcus_DN1.PRE.4
MQQCTTSRTHCTHTDATATTAATTAAEKKDAEALARQAAQDAVLGNDVANGGEGDAVGHKPLQMLRVWALREYLQVR